MKVAKKRLFGIFSKAIVEALEERTLLAAAPTYAVIDLGAGDTFGNPNQNGYILGESGPVSAPTAALIYDPTTETVDPISSLPPGTGGLEGNDSGEVAGTIVTTGSDGNVTSTTNFAIGPLSISGGVVSGTSNVTSLQQVSGTNGVFDDVAQINDANQIAGTAEAAASDGRDEGVIWSASGAVTQTISEPGVDIEVAAINNVGAVCGTDDQNNTTDGFIYQGGLPHNFSNNVQLVVGINNLGHVLYESNSGVESFLYNGSTSVDLGAFAPAAFNDSDVVVGTTPAATEPMPVSSGDIPIIEQNGTITTIQSLFPANSGWTVDNVTGIGNSGAITGTGSFNGVESAFLLIPNASYQTFPAKLTAMVTKNLSSSTVGSFSYSRVLPVSNFTASIDWGDGTTTASATIQLSGTTYNVIANHMYDKVGTYNIRISIQNSDGTSTSFTSTAKIEGPIHGVVHDVQYLYPKSNIVTTHQLLSGVTVNLLDDQGNVVATSTSEAGGKFSINPPATGASTIEFGLTTSYYDTSSNAILSRVTYVGEPLPATSSSTNEIDLGSVYMPKTMLDTAAKLLMGMNNYTQSGFQNLKSTQLDLYRFDTTGAEAVIQGLDGTVSSPSPMFDPNNLTISSNANPDPWVGAMRMLGDMADVDARFRDMINLADITGKFVSVLLSAAAGKGIGKGVVSLDASLFGKKVLTLPVWGGVAAQTLKGIQADRVAAFTLVGSLLGVALDKAGVSGPDKAAVQAIYFGVVRYATDIFNGKFFDDATFEALFTPIRIIVDAGLLKYYTGVSLRPDAFSTGVLNSALNIITGVPPSVGLLQQAINDAVSNAGTYVAKTDTNVVLTALDNFNLQQSKVALRFQFVGSVLSGNASLVRGGTGALSLYQAAGDNLTPTESEIQSSMQRINRFLNTFSTQAYKEFAQLEASAQNAIAKADVEAGKEVGLLIMLSAFADSLLGLAQQSLSVQNLLGIESGQTPPPSSDVAIAPAATVAIAAPVEKLAAKPAAAPKINAAAVTLPSDTLAYNADLANISKYAKTADVNSIAALFPQLVADDQSLFASDLNLTDERADALLPQLSSKAALWVFKQFDGAMQIANQTSMFFYAQLNTWGGNPAAGSAKILMQQIATTQQAVNTAALLDQRVKTAIAGLIVPAALVIDETSVPLQMNVGDVQTFTFTVTNVGDQASVDDALSFINDDGSLNVQGAASQALAALAPGASAAISWQVQAATSTDPQSNGGAFQVLTGVQSQMISLEDSVQIG